MWKRWKEGKGEVIAKHHVIKLYGLVSLLVVRCGYFKRKNTILKLFYAIKNKIIKTKPYNDLWKRDVTCTVRMFPTESKLLKKVQGGNGE